MSDEAEQRPRWGSEARKWWRNLQPAAAEDGRLKGDRAALARLRRAATPIDAAQEAAALDLYRRLGFKSHEIERRLPSVLMVAVVLAHVRDDDCRMSVARALGKQNDTAVMSELRFRRLMATEGEDNLLIAGRRLVAMLGRKANVGDLAESFLDWSEKRRMRWAFDYYSASDAAPNASNHANTQTDEHTEGGTS